GGGSVGVAGDHVECLQADIVDLVKCELVGIAGDRADGGKLRRGAFQLAGEGRRHRGILEIQGDRRGHVVVVIEDGGGGQAAGGSAGAGNQGRELLIVKLGKIGLDFTAAKRAVAVGVCAGNI